MARMTGTVIDKTPSGEGVIRFETSRTVDEIVKSSEKMPLPHYIKH